jgi:hypothetical protein
MESDNYKDYWNEIRILGLHETKLLDEYLGDVEEYGPKSYEGKFSYFHIHVLSW